MKQTVAELERVGGRVVTFGMVAMVVIAIMAVVSQTALYGLLSVGETDARLINTAGKQRMLSQRLAYKVSEVVDSRVAGDRTGFLASSRALASVAAEMDSSLAALGERAIGRGLGGRNSEAVNSLYESLEQDRAAMVEGVKKLTRALRASTGAETANDARDIEKLVHEIHAAAERFLPVMDEIVGLYEEESRARTWWIGCVYLVIGIIKLLLLFALVRFLVYPASKLLQRTAAETSQVIHRLEEAEHEASQLAEFARRSTNMMIRTDAEVRIVWVNDGFTRVTGYRLDEVVGRKPGEVLQCENTDPSTIEAMRRAIDAGEPFRGRVLNRSKAGEDYWLDIEFLPEFDRAGALSGFIAVESDVTELVAMADRAQHLAETLTAAHERFELALAGSRDAIFDWDVAGESIYFAPRWTALLGCSEADLGTTIGTLLQRVASTDVRRVEEAINAFVSGGGSSIELEFGLMTDEGDVLWVLLRAAARRGAHGEALRVSGSVADITRLKKTEDRMRSLVQQDQLTGLASRSRFIECLEHALSRRQRTGKHCAVLFLDFDRFKVVNDTLGHEVGDGLLRSIAERLRSNTREIDIQARLGGDEFVILLEGLDTPASARPLADKLLKLCAEPHHVGGHRLVSTASIGLVTTERGSSGALEMLRDADAAMYQAKAGGRGCVVEFDEGMYRTSLDRYALEQDLREAVAKDQLRLYYQPIVDLQTGRVVSAEALIRWTHPERGVVSPGEFIPIAEESNQMEELGTWIYTEACRQLVAWKQSGVLPEGFAVSINLSKVQLLSPGFVERLSACIREWGIAPGELKLEVTETTVVDNRAGVAEILKELQGLGFTVMMDDFGTGHSSLSGLHQLPIDELKIDQSFIRSAERSRDLIAITTSIVTLAGHLSLRTVGEGIETAEHLALLQDLGCMYGQGYYFSKPLPAETFASWVAGQERAEAA
ncbi:EAL domain-containing protein [Mucisphaera sp.]|uniref:EAL domain-containing protein n=1 Tax=Mucisphaera sp. TaxID=2913024 RepID=UPI003D116D71